MMGFVDDIDSVPWDKLHHAYGAAIDVPELLQALMLPESASSELCQAATKNNRSVFDQITWTLWGNVFHQGSVWQVTATTVPFFAAILRDGPDHPEYKAFLITYLHHLAVGYPDDIFPEIPNPDEDFDALVGITDTGDEPDYSPECNRSLIWIRDSYEAVERHVEDIVPYLHAVDDSVADAAIAFCASFPRRADLTIPLLRRLASKSNQRGATAAISLAVLGDTEVGTLAKSIAASSDTLTAILGACASVLYDPEGTLPDIFAILTTPLNSLGQAEVAHSSTVDTLVGLCLEQLGPNYRNRAATAISEQLVGASPMDVLALTKSLLTIIFPDSRPPRAAELSTTQRRALEAIRDHGAFKISGGTFANYTGLLAGWGLPQSADAIETWLRSS